MELLNLKSLVAKLEAKAAKAKKDSDASVAVGYTAAYALPVHENLQAKHTVGQAKFLEEPARTEASKMGDITNKELKKGRTMAQALLMAGLYLLRCSMLLVPVATGNLKNSGFARLEE